MVDQLQLGDLSTYADDDRESFIRQSFLAYHSRIGHPVALHVEEHCSYMLRRLNQMSTQVKDLTAMIHANDLLRQEAEHGRAQARGPTGSDDSSLFAGLHTRVRQLEDQVEILMAVTPPSKSIPAAQRIASSRRGSSVGDSRSRSDTHSRGRSSDSAPQPSASSRNSSSRSKRSMGSAYPHIFTTLQCSFCTHIIHVSGKSNIPIRAVCEVCVRTYTQNNMATLQTPSVITATPQAFPVCMTVGTFPTVTPFGM